MAGPIYLTDEQRARCDKRRAEGAGWKTIATELGMSETTIRAARYRGRECDIPKGIDFSILPVGTHLADPEPIYASDAAAYAREHKLQSTLSAINAFRVGKGLTPWFLRRRAA